MLETRNLDKSFGGIKAVRSAGFSLAQGEIRGVIGPNGAGKTTFVSLLCGRLKPSAGSIVFMDQDITDLPAHHRTRLGIAYTFQITSIYSRLTVAENIAIASRYRMDDSSPLASHVQQIAELSGLNIFLNQEAGNLAYGHQRMVEVAMGLALTPRLLILDEPTQGLSDSEIGDFCSLIKKTAASATILLIEHNMDVVMGLAENITVFDHGEIIAEGRPGEIKDNTRVQAAYLGKA